jgi:adenosine deaminase
MTDASPKIAALPKVVLHDHLDGGLRPATLIELASEPSFKAANPDFALPSYDPDNLLELIHQGARSGSLVEYLKPFAYTVAVMQNRESLTRIAAECVADLATDGVVYAESRFAPGLSTERGLTEHQVVEAVLEGFAQGMATAAKASKRIEVRALLCTLRHWEPTRSVATAQVAVDFHRTNSGVVGFDIAGPEAGFPPSQHAEAFALLRKNQVPFTIHAGEAAGVDSIAEAVQLGARRLGHGVRIIEDIHLVDEQPRFGSVASQVRDERIVLETCPCSNVDTTAVSSLSEHPLPQLHRWGFATTINTDNRLMSGTSMSNEFSVALNNLGLDRTALHAMTVNAMNGAFAPSTLSEQLISTTINPAYTQWTV